MTWVFQNALSIAAAVAMFFGATASALGAGTEHIEGLYLGNIVNNDCEATIRAYKVSAARGMAILKKQKSNPSVGTSDSEPSYMLIKGNEIRDTSRIYSGSIINVVKATPTDTWFTLQGKGSVKLVMKLRLNHVEGNRWMFFQFMRGKTVKTLEHVGPILTGICKLR